MTKIVHSNIHNLLVVLVKSAENDTKQFEEKLTFSPMYSSHLLNKLRIHEI